MLPHRAIVAFLAFAMILCAHSPARAQICSETGTWASDYIPLAWSLIGAPDGTFAGVAYSPSGPNVTFPASGSRVGDTLTFDEESFLAREGRLSEDCTTIVMTLTPLPYLTLTRIRDTVCGDGSVDPGEQCDDGNFTNGDVCTVGCAPPGCGNFILESLEECDDGDLTDGDGCSFDCKACGNGGIDSGEECDDGNRLNGDGCDDVCQFQSCGNGILEPGEQCDDGNGALGDGCTPTCIIEGCPLTGAWEGSGPFAYWWFLEEPDTHFTAATSLGVGGPFFPAEGTRDHRAVTGTLHFGTDGNPFTAFQDSCNSVTIQLEPFSISLARIQSGPCGNGTTESGEECDDGNLANDDGCQVNCRLPGCGDGVLTAPEECEDGNVTDGDGCSSGCVHCGNGIVGPGEECDGGLGCTPGCVLSACSSFPKSGCRKLTGNGRSILQFKQSTRDSRDAVMWKWDKGVDAYPFTIGRPLADTNYRFCVYGESGLAFEAVVPAGNACSACWSAKGDGFRYASQTRFPDGITNVSLAPTGRNGAKYLLRGKGAMLSGRNYALPALPLSAPLTAQLQGSHGYCFGAEYPAAGVKRNRNTEFFAVGGSPSAAFVAPASTTALRTPPQ